MIKLCLFLFCTLFCTKYHDLYMEALHEAIECRDIQNKTPKEKEKCDKISKLLSEYSNLRLVHCYNEWQTYEL